jgi:hypothetical protein
MPSKLMADAEYLAAFMKGGTVIIPNLGREQIYRHV